MITLLVSFLFFSCADEKETTKLMSEVKLERWTVKGDKTSYEKDKIQYLETSLYNEKGEVKATAYYDNNKSLTGKETKVFEGGMLKGAQFKDVQDSLLSYYTYDLTTEGLVSLSKAFDAANDDLLRQESFEYNSRGHVISKIIKDYRGLVVRKFEFTVDELGNEMEVRVLNPDNSSLLIETFKVTKADDQNNWIEKWGFVNDEPFSYLAREIKYQ